jgi:hypothetical protein
MTPAVTSLRAGEPSMDRFHFFAGDGTGAPLTRRAG